MQKIIWALDAFPAESQKANLKALAQLKALATQTNLEIEPVYVLTPDEHNRLRSGSEFPWTKELKLGAEKAMKGFLSKTGLKVRPPRVLLNTDERLSVSVKLLNAHAKSVGADLILVSTHARKGLKRIFMGSFTESLLLTSEVPVLVVSPASQPVKAFKKILYSTDLSPSSRDGFEKVVEQAKVWGSKIVLYYHVPSPVEPLLAGGSQLLGGSYIPIQAYFDQKRIKQEEMAQGWKEWCKKQGVKCQLIVRYQAESIAPSILKVAKKEKAHLIAMTSKVGRAGAFLMGSIARQVVRESERPVWVLHESEDEAAPTFEEVRVDDSESPLAQPL